MTFTSWLQNGCHKYRNHIFTLGSKAGRQTESLFFMSFSQRGKLFQNLGNTKGVPLTSHEPALDRIIIPSLGAGPISLHQRESSRGLKKTGILLCKE